MTAQRIDGSVMRRNVCQLPAPSVRAACSCSSPTSCSVGMTSRATNGSETKIVAITIAGRAKRTSMPWSDSQLPNHPSRPYRRKSERPTTTGESASGRSMKALSSPLPQNVRRTMAIAQTIPNTVFTGTAIAVMIKRQLQRVDRLRRRQRVPRRREPVLERPPEHHRQRPDEDHREIAERDEA